MGWQIRLGLVVVVLALILRVFIVQTLRVPSRSMEDSLLVGDYLLVDKAAFGVRLPFSNGRLPGWSEPQAGDILVYRHPPDPGRTYVKRCIATAGRQVEIRNKVIYVDGERLIDPAFSKYIDVHIIPKKKGPRDNWGPKRVPQGHLFVMGDNRDNSRDSRHWGFLPTELVVGKAVGIHWSCRPAGPRLDSDESWWSRLSSWGRNLPRRVRWYRMGTWL